MLKLCGFLLLVAVAGIQDAGASEAPPLFVEVSSGGDATPAEAYLGLWSVEVNAERLRTPVAAIALNLPDHTHVEIQRLHWEARRGYVTQLDDDGVAQTIPDPEAGPDDFSWLWYGKGEGWTVSLTMHKGVVAGRVSSAERRYGLEPRPERVTQLGWINSDYWTTHPEERPGMTPGKNPSKQFESGADRTGIVVGAPFDALVPSTNKTTWDVSCSATLDTSSVSVVDILVLYTPEYLSNAGSVVQVEAAVQAALDDANTSLRNSEIHAVRYALSRVEAVPAAPGFNWDSQGIVAVLNRLSGNNSANPPCDFSSPNAAVQARREANYADVVALARKATNPTDTSCGIAWIQHKVSSPFCAMEPGLNWGDTFPYLVFNTQCNGDRLNFAHELGHILGMEHDPINSDTGRPEIKPSCPWSYGHRRADTSLAQSKRFRTVMSYWENDPQLVGVPGPPACANSTDCQQIDGYSNWNLQWAGASGIQPLPLASGNAAIGVQTPPAFPPNQPQAQAYDTLQRIGEVVARFRNRPQEIFSGDFE